MNGTKHFIEKVHTSIDTFTTIARNEHGHEFLERHIEELPFKMRIAKKALLAAHDFNPNFFYNRLVHPYEKTGRNVIGIGFHAITLLDGQNVLKIYRHTTDMDEQKQAALKQYWELKQSKLLNHLPDFAVPQQFFIDSHPLHPEKSIVIARQPYVSHEAAIRVPLARVDNLSEQSFHHACLQMHENISALPDVVGRDNVISTRSGIKIIDTIPLEASDPADAHSFTVAQKLFGISTK